MARTRYVFRIGHVTHPHSDEALRFVEFDSSGQDELLLGAPAIPRGGTAPGHTSNVRFVYLDRAGGTGELVTVWPDHCPPELVEHRPGRLLAVESRARAL